MKRLFKIILPFTLSSFLIVAVTAWTIAGSAGTVFALEGEAEEGFVDAAYAGEETENGDTGEGEYQDDGSGEEPGENDDYSGDTGESESEDSVDETGDNENAGESGETGSDEDGSGETDGNEDGSGENDNNEDPGENGETGSEEDGTGDNGDDSSENGDKEDGSGDNGEEDDSEETEGKDESGENDGNDPSGEKEENDPSGDNEKKEDTDSGDKEKEDEPSGDNKEQDNNTEDDKDEKDTDPEEDELEDPDEKKYEGDDWEKEEDLEKEKNKQSGQQFAGESGTTDFATLPLLELGSEELTICSFCEGKSLGNIQKAVMLSYLMSYRELNEETSDTSLIDSVGIGKEAYRKWCEKQELETADIRNQLSYIYSALFRNADQKNTKDRFVSAFRNAKNVTIAAASLYAAASARSIKLPYTKEQIMQNVVPKAQHYAELFALGGEKRDGTANVTYYGQGNYANVPYDTGNVADSGCGITAFSMVASEFTGLNLGPEVTSAWESENGGGNTVTNWGTYWFLAQRFGLRFLGQYSGGFDTAVEALKEGDLVIASLRKDGFFTTSDIGHYILLTGVEKDGRICVNDPASYERSLAGPFDYSAVFGCCIQYWIFGR